jgi:hypothetical protein
MCRNIIFVLMYHRHKLSDLNVTYLLVMIFQVSYEGCGAIGESRRAK